MDGFLLPLPNPIYQQHQQPVKQLHPVRQPRLTRG
jgi:hypothetical protein